MQPGKLRHKIQIKQPTETNTDGEVTRTWATKYNVWAQVRTPTGREIEQQSHILPNLTHVVTIRWKSDIKPEWRVYWRGRALHIGSVAPDEKNKEFLVLRCTEKVV